MKTITIWLMKYNLKKAVKRQKQIDNYIIKKAYDDCIKTYENTIMFLIAEQGKY